MKKRTYNLLLEALRRYCSFSAGESLSRAWLGLGTEADYRQGINDGYFTWHDGRVPPKRCMGWLVLTEKGQKVILNWLAHGYHVKNYGDFLPSLPPQD